jgi:tyrosyl-tRNA synthetase
MNKFLDELRWRGFLHSMTSGADAHLANPGVTGYVGFDPTASSLHVGSLLPIMGLVHLQRAGHRPIAVAGGGTGMVGDPSGKSAERKLLTIEEIEANLEGIKRQLAHFLDFESRPNAALLVNNADWLRKLLMMDFLRDIGKHFSVNEMLAKDSIKSRISQEQGMSFTEFSYSLLQSYDFLELFDRQGCTLQMGGSDQWGNIVAGVDLIRRLRGAEAHAVVFPLMTTSTGSKFGKTEQGTIWLDPARTSPYRFYQFWINVDDRDVLKFLRFFTLLASPEIAAFEEEDPSKREAQKLLAREVTKMVHGEGALAQAERATQVFFGGSLAGITATELQEIFEDVPSVEMEKEKLSAPGLPVADALVAAAAAKSKGEARRLIEGGGVYINNVQVTDPDRRITSEDSVQGRFVLLRKGRKSYSLLRLI